MEQNCKIEKIIKEAKMVLDKKGKPKRATEYIPEQGLGGDYFIEYFTNTYRKKGLSIRYYKERFSDGSGHTELKIYEKKGIFKKSELVFSKIRNKIEIIKGGDWKKDLEQRAKSL